MRKDDWERIISYPPEKEEPIAEIYYKNEQCFEINYEDYGFFVVKFYNRRDRNYWEFPYDEAMEFLQEAKAHLRGHATWRIFSSLTVESQGWPWGRSPEAERGEADILTSRP